MATVYTRAGKGSALTWTEADANITNLNTAKLENVVEDTTPQLGGNLDVNGNAITSATNGNVRIEPNGSGNIALTPTTGKIIVGALDFPTGTGTNGQVLTTNGSTAMTWTTPSTGATTLDGLTDVVITAAATNDVLRFDGTNWVDTAASGLTVGNVSGTVAIANGGTGATSAPAANAALNGFTTTATAAGITTLTNTSSVYQLFTGTSTQSVRLPSTATLAQGWSFHIVNNSTSNLTLQNATPSTLGTIYPGTTVMATCISTADNTNASWEFGYRDFSTRTGTGAVVLGTSPTLTSPNLGEPTSLVVTNATGTGSININGTVGATTPSTGVFTGLTAKGATNTAKLTLDTTAVSSTAWGTNGIGIRANTAIYTDTSSLAGTVAASHIHAIAAPTMASTNAITVTDAASLYIANGPTAGTNTTITNKWALLTAGNIKSAGATIGGTTLPTSTGTTGQVLALSSAGVAAWTTSSGGSAPNITDDTASATTHYLIIDDATSGAIAPKTSSTKLTFVPSTGVLTATGFAGALNGTVGATTPAAGTFTTMTANTAVLDDIRETVFALTYGATITPDAANGSVQTVTLTGNVTFSAFSNPVSGQTITLIITQDATGSRTLTSTMKFAGGSKTLTTTANAIDILTVSYIGTTYYASLSKGFA